MKKFLKNDVYIIITLLFIVLIFKNNTLFKKCIINGCNIFFYQVFPSLLPMFILNDFLISYNFIFYLNKLFNKPLKKLFNFSNAATYTFILSLFSGTPTNGYILKNLVRENNLNEKDASIILSYSFFLSPLFLYNIINTILCDYITTIKIIFITYSTNFIIAFFYRKYNYQNITIENNTTSKNFSNILTNSINHSFSTLINILGTIIFYFIICEGINIFIKNPSINCFINGFLEVTGGLTKLNNLNISFSLKKLFVITFASFGGLSIHSQIKSIITDANISYKLFLKARIIHTILATCACVFIT